MSKNTFRNRKKKQASRPKIKVSTNAKKGRAVIITTLFLAIMVVSIAIYETQKLPTGALSGGNTTNNFRSSINGLQRFQPFLHGLMERSRSSL